MRKYTPSERAKRRRKKVDPFYKSKEWFKARSMALRLANYRCATCQASVRGKGAFRVHHRLPRKKFPELALHVPNLMVLCVTCDNTVHSRDRAGSRKDDASHVGLDGLPSDGSWG